ncbi:MAG: hypothetical protein RI925_1064 [Pseudomonadota bacterium]
MPGAKRTHSRLENLLLTACEYKECLFEVLPATGHRAGWPPLNPYEAASGARGSTMGVTEAADCQLGAAVAHRLLSPLQTARQDTRGTAQGAVQRGAPVGCQ